MVCLVACKRSGLVGDSRLVCHWETVAAEASRSTARHAGPIARLLGLVGYSARQISHVKENRSGDRSLASLAFVMMSSSYTADTRCMELESANGVGVLPQVCIIMGYHSRWLA